jgi:hypothetical protein
MHTMYTYIAADQPAMLAESWEPMAVTGSSLVVLPEAGPYAGIGVADRMNVLGIDVGTPVERVRARAATRAEATRFGVAPGVPVMAVERTYYDQAHRAAGRDRGPGAARVALGLGVRNAARGMTNRPRPGRGGRAGAKGRAGQGAGSVWSRFSSSMENA